jgi:hypothetical protein
MEVIILTGWKEQNMQANLQNQLKADFYSC